MQTEFDANWISKDDRMDDRLGLQEAAFPDSMTTGFQWIIVRRRAGSAIQIR